MKLLEETEWNEHHICLFQMQQEASLHAKDQQSSGPNALQGAVHVPVQVSAHLQHWYTQIPAVWGGDSWFLLD